MEESVSRQDAKVLPAGSPAALRRIRRPASSRPRISSSSRMRTTSAGSHRWAIAYARDGYALLEAVYDRSAPPWLRELPAVDVLRRVLLQNYTRTITADGREVIRRREKEPDGDGLPRGHARVASPYDTDARWGVKREEFWLGYKLDVTETCDDPAPCNCRPRAAGQDAAGSAGASGHDKSCAHLTAPNLITHVATTDATVTDNQMTSAIHQDLARKNLAPGRSYLDSGYLSAALVVSALTTWGIALIGPLLADTSAQARAGKGYARADLTAGYDARTVTCPQGKTSASWSSCTQHGRRHRGHLLRPRLRPLPGPGPMHHQRRQTAAPHPAAPRPGPSPGRRPRGGTHDTFPG
jgi:hypothetical protein